MIVHIDNGPAGSRRTGTATVFVEVQDVNDNRPIFLQNSYETSILESVPQRTSILKVGNTPGPCPSRDKPHGQQQEPNPKNQSQGGPPLAQVASVMNALITHCVSYETNSLNAHYL